MQQLVSINVLPGRGRAAAFVGCLLVASALTGCNGSGGEAASLPPQLTPGGNGQKIELQVRAFCGDCHAVPKPETFPVAAWRTEVQRGFDFYARSGRQDLAIPALEEIVSYYEALAPERLKVKPPAASAPSDDSPARFRPDASASQNPERPAVSFLQTLCPPHLDDERLFVCDMRSGVVGAATVAPHGTTMESLTALLHPARVSLCDLDGDKQDEMVIAELGSFSSEDHHRGAVVWLRWDKAQGAWQQRLLVGGLGRVADVRSADFDGDGDQDLVVAEFGHLLTGRVVVYENLGLEQGLPKLREHVVDQRHGTIHVPVADLNGDSRPDFVALISQEHEVVEAFINKGSFQFQRQTIFAAGDPSQGSSGIQLVDLDADDDLDVLYTNGDTFGSEVLKPYHGISWLENRGTYPYTEHRLADLVGVQAAIAADFDGDDDLDIAAAGFLPPNLADAPELAHHDSLIWLEQKEQGRFVRHGLQAAKFFHAALAAGDFDKDGDNDLAVGGFQGSTGEHEPWFTIWWNTSK